MSLFLENAHKIFDVACAGPASENSDFALFIGAEGGMHVRMEPSGSVDFSGPGAAYRVVRTRDGVRVTGKTFNQTCVLEDRRGPAGVSAGPLLRDQPLYTLSSAMRLE